MENIYIVTFEIHRNCQIMSFVYYCYAKNAKEACNNCKYYWRGEGHQFHIHAVKSKIQDIELLNVNKWNGHRVSGNELIGKYLMVDSKTWRVKTSYGYEYPLAKGLF